ncbi:MAG: tagaturonate epimerase family protein, partial [Alphaproteobacteria bacterium]
YVGRFEKGVDYIGDRRLFASHFERHVAIARTLGPYKLSLHSGSDKFSIYPIVAQLAGNLIHLKTAGTSYLEALRAVARVEPALFREILAFAIAHYEEDRASYHVSADMRRVPAPDTVPDAELPNVLDQFDARQALHVTFGSVLTATDAHGQPIFRDRLYQVLEGDEEAHYAALEAHLARHLRPFSDYKR